MKVSLSHKFVTVILILVVLMAVQVAVAARTDVNVQPSSIQEPNSIKYKEKLNTVNRLTRDIRLSTSFPCDLENIPVRSDQIPNSVHKLRPGDIDVIGAIGDSLSAGASISAKNPFEMIQSSEQRGRAFSGGGEDTWRSYLTLPNILKEFNPNLIGYGLKASTIDQKESQLNVALLGAKSEDTIIMAEDLVKRIKEDNRVDFKNHWKMVTIMIGYNDFCQQMCKYKDYYTWLDKHRQDLLQTLRYLRDNLPRTVVNIVPPTKLNMLLEMKNLPMFCFIIHSADCPCLEYFKDPKTENLFNDLMLKWHQVDLEVSDMPEFDLDGFTVIPHHFTLNNTFPKTSEGVTDYRWFAPDCFHFSADGHARLATNLWNSLLEPFGTKDVDVTENPITNFFCSSEKYPYIFTRRNSQ